MGYSRGMELKLSLAEHRGTVARLALRAAMLASAMCVAWPAMALYKVVGPDGKVTYTDRAPVDQPSQQISKGGVVSAAASLPYELRQVASRYPVVLYTQPECGVCDQARNFLKTRGVPFAEKQVLTPADAAALRKAENTTDLPVARVGQQQLQGFKQSDWAQYLDAAGYPKASTLPAGYAWPAAVPLTTPPAPAREAKPGDTRVRNVPAEVTPPSATDGNPAGIRF